MGFTHYFEFTPTEKTEKQFKLVLKDCAKIMAAKPAEIGIFGWDESKGGFFGEPEFTPDLICFNGDESNGLEHETLYFDPKKETDFSFCKTARKPYDLVVCAVLISLANRLDGFKFSSDGNLSDGKWKDAFKLYRSIGGRLKKGKKDELKKYL